MESIEAKNAERQLGGNLAQASHTTEMNFQRGKVQVVWKSVSR